MINAFSYDGIYEATQRCVVCFRRHRFTILGLHACASISVIFFGAFSEKYSQEVKTATIGVGAAGVLADSLIFFREVFVGIANVPIRQVDDPFYMGNDPRDNEPFTGV